MADEHAGVGLCLARLEERLIIATLYENPAFVVFEPPLPAIPGDVLSVGREVDDEARPLRSRMHVNVKRAAHGWTVPRTSQSSDTFGPSG